VDGSEAGLYLWVTRDEDCWASLDSLARLGILAAPGEFYGPAGSKHVRVALTATDERVAAAAGRLRTEPHRAVGLSAHRQPSSGAICRSTLSRTCAL
jgi:hypothetical protein